MMQAALSGGTLGRIVTAAITRYSDREALSDGVTRWTYNQLGDAIARYLTVFRTFGLGKGTGVAVLSSNRVEPFAMLCAANLLGVRYTPMHPLAAEDDHVDIVSDSEADVLIVDGAKFGERAAAIRARMPHVKVWSIGPSGTLPDVLAAAADAVPASLTNEADSEDIAYLVYTGGTTGKSKGVMLSHRSLATMTTIIAAEWEWPAVPRYGVVTPISHAGGINIYPVLYLGGYARMLQGFNAETFCRVVNEEKLNCTFLVPTLINSLIDAAQIRARFDLSSLELIIYGAAPMSPDRLRSAIEIFGRVFLQLYGQSESPQCVATLRKIDHDLAKPERLGSCGLPVPLMEVRLCDAQMREVAVGEPGEICLRGPLLMSGYWRQPEMTEKVMEGGWLHTGDVAIRDADGYHFIVDRVKDMIISGGFNIYPREVEDALMSYPGVALVAVIGVPDRKWGEAVKAFVVLQPGSNVAAEELQAHVKAKRGGPWAPKSIEFVSEIPLTGLGKIDRKALREKYWRDQPRAVS
jgi:fatty-acyl-CoA synthase